MTPADLAPATGDDPIVRPLAAAALLDLLLALLLLTVGVTATSAQVVAFVVAWPVALRRTAAIQRLWRGGGDRPVASLAAIASLGLTAVLTRGALLVAMIERWTLPPVVAIVVAVAVGAGLFALALREVDRTDRDAGRAVAWGAVAAIVVAAMLVVRVAFLGLPELMPEEAYYWLYAQHLAPGYLDHPPMVAWLIALGGALFGHNEFAVRIGALLCWSIAAVYLFRLATLLFDRSVAWLSVALLSILPIFAGIGFTMTPDSPLMAAWMAALFYLHRAALGGQARAWYGVGIAVGLGMLSKYTIVLLGPIALLVVLLHPPARMWLRRREPYLGALIALGLFSPVLYWNAHHEWASFVFQGPRRFAGRIKFSVFRYFRELLVVMTPSGIAATCVALWGARAPDDGAGLPDGRPRRTFVLVAFLVPFTAFLLYSVRQKTKLNWAAPAFLVMLPCIAHQIIGFHATAASRFRRGLHRSWVPTFVALGLIYTVVLSYVAVGFPGVGYRANSRRFIGWQSLGEQVTDIAQQQERDLGVRPVIVGMDSHDLSSELSFYTRPPALRLRGRPETITGVHQFGRDSLMFRFWDGPETFTGRPMLLVSRDAAKLRDEVLVGYFEGLDPVGEITTTRRGKPVGTYFYRLGRGYRGPPR